MFVWRATDLEVEQLVAWDCGGSEQCVCVWRVGSVHQCGNDSLPGCPWGCGVSFFRGAHAHAAHAERQVNNGNGDEASLPIGCDQKAATSVSKLLASASGTKVMRKAC